MEGPKAASRQLEHSPRRDADEPLESGQQGQNQHKFSESSEPMPQKAESTYRYPKISTRQIRLLSPLPATDDVLQYKYTVVSLDDEPSFSALSYVWGGEKATKTIYVDGKRFTVRANLYDFLLQSHMENATFGSGIFIDALGIDQNNNEERSEQVRFMGNVYRDAANVIVWFGVEAEWAPELEIESGSKAERDVSSAIVNGLKGNPYWTRVWTVQEFIAPTTLILRAGAVIIPESLFHCALDHCALEIGERCQRYLDARNERVRCANVAGTAADEDMLKASFGQYPLHYLINRFKGQECTESQDALYGLLGLTDSCLMPEYDLSLKEVYVGALMHGLLEIVRVGAADSRILGTASKYEYHINLAETLGLNANGTFVWLVAVMGLLIVGFDDDIVGQIMIRATDFTTGEVASQKQFMKDCWALIQKPRIAAHIDGDGRFPLPKWLVSIGDARTEQIALEVERSYTTRFGGCDEIEIGPRCIFVMLRKVLVSKDSGDNRLLRSAKDQLRTMRAKDGAKTNRRRGRW
ncbi:hypothetical protein LTR17_006010 [Elasticomyces elasticus]|nr:hypothetical protein LTR17_006010 [Elasticomyces elasticus]